jgi:outer membrane protein OmpA-like peptidoglycan-associated protein
MIGEIDRLNDELAKKPKEVEVVKYVDRTDNAPVTNAVATTGTDTYVFFAFNSAELDDRAKAELDKIGQNGVYDIVAFASNEGNKEYNKALSQRRADAVKKYLEDRGCKINSAEGKGVVFGPTTGRVAIVTIK